MKLRVELSPKAERDVDDILTWIGQRSTKGAHTWSKRWDEVLEQLSNSAGSCGRAPESSKHDAELYQIVFKTRRGLPYRALFTINADVVSVVTVRGPGQDYLSPDEH